VRIGVPVERASCERRVALTPAAVAELATEGHVLFVESGAGCGAGLTDDAYLRAGGRVTEDLEELFAEAEGIIGLGPPGAAGLPLLRPSHLLLGFLNLPARPALATELCDSGATCVALEEVTGSDHGLPLLAPMSELAGRLAVLAGAGLVGWPGGGPGVMLGGATGVPPARVVVVGAGVAGWAAARQAGALGAAVVALDNDLERLRALERSASHGSTRTLFATRLSVADEIARADLVIGAVHRRWHPAPMIAAREAWLAPDRPMAVVDVSIDRGGCFETSRDTSHEAPVYSADGVLHHCVPNLPSAVAVTASAAFSASALAYVSAVARAWDEGGLGDPVLSSGVALHRGRARHPALARATGLPYAPVERVSPRQRPFAEAA
jgi:alanine dehydrogenase